MATVYRKTYTKPMPPDAELFTKTVQKDGDRSVKRFARWRGKTGKMQTAEVTTPTEGKYAGLDRVVMECETWTAKYRDGRGIVREVQTGCRDEQNARAVLGELTTRAELVKAKVISAAEDAISDHAETPIADHIKAYMTSLEADGTTPKHRDNVKRCLKLIAVECKFDELSQLRRDSFESWLASKTRSKMSARTRNMHHACLIAFANWCVSTHRLALNPFTNITKANEAADRKRIRRALTEDELRRLLYVARRRPLADFGRDVKDVEADPLNPKRANWKYAKLTPDTIEAAEARGRKRLAKRPDFIAELERRGREHSLIYKTLVLTGLRRGELQSLTVGQLDIGPRPYITLHAADEKARRGAEIPLRRDLADDLGEWIAGKLERARAEASRSIGPLGATPILMRLPSDTPLFNVAREFVRIFDRDREAAGIPKHDDRGRSVDVHALRHTFATLLSKGNVSLRTAQAAMRHSDPSLTANVYTDPRMLDVAGAVESLPTLPLTYTPKRERAKAMGTYGKAGMLVGDGSTLAPTLAPATGNRCQFQTIGDNMTASAAEGGIVENALNHRGKSTDDDCSLKAGDGIRTHDVQLGKLAFYH